MHQLFSSVRILVLMNKQQAYPDYVKESQQDYIFLVCLNSHKCLHVAASDTIFSSHFGLGQVYSDHSSFRSTMWYVQTLAKP